ncbi:uncharacterized protein MEPE_06606 [Melanopsichium pennsylvanicum]|uniref:Uncharacterized protein n=1 Tax=Melanopsichium pennsylvanicum TaxID=63383 RepID=A0AAJ4XSS9_9BASI|nr:uncharacterized protein MEPE_06606 [Melanopsichium pennsylvanicum]
MTSTKWDKKHVEEIDLAPDKWLHSVPSHLMYNPDEPDDKWLLQSSLLYCKYFDCQFWRIALSFLQVGAMESTRPSIFQPSPSAQTQRAASFTLSRSSKSEICTTSLVCLA